MKKIDFNKNLYDLTKQYPEIIHIMDELGFTEINNKTILSSMGKVMTIPQGAKMHNISMEKIREKFNKNNFEIINYQIASENNSSIIEQNSVDRVLILKNYLKRLGEGEELEIVQKDFKNNFKNVDSSEIMKAEQSLIEDGTPINELQKLCDLHSSLFHGSTLEEKITNAEKSIQESNYKYDSKKFEDKITKTKKLKNIDGHPLNTFARENDELRKLIKKLKNALDTKTNFYDALYNMKDISIHYAKKGDLLYPHLDSKYNITGPSNVMWTVDDEIRQIFSSLLSDKDNYEKNIQKYRDVLKRIEEMIYKEENILFPNCAMNFTEKEWINIYKDMLDYDKVFGIAPKTWKKGENTTVKEQFLEGEITLSGGHLNINELDCLLNTIPLEITFVDANNINKYFNEGEKIMKRPKMAIDRSVFTCHPPKVQKLVKAIIDDLKNGRKDNVPVWLEKQGHTLYINYIAVKDDDKNYVGTLEVVQDMTFAKNHFLKLNQ
ncbi:DUF438 domain-containing protein [Peptoniphilus olsenii]|uniref:DUF438 domain-containing protein n=1 Tax=Peptoniphilus olsenii TaxID=411570 RepID=A0ABV2J821_9FIRM